MRAYIISGHLLDHWQNKMQPLGQWLGENTTEDIEDHTSRPGANDYGTRYDQNEEDETAGDEEETPLRKPGKECV
jgi:hypothetical protein